MTALTAPSGDARRSGGDPTSTQMNQKLADCRRHVLTVYDGAEMIGSLVQAGGEFHAFDVDGVHVGTFNDMRSAARALPASDPADRLIGLRVVNRKSLSGGRRYDR
jgi:hypothetical protein